MSIEIGIPKPESTASAQQKLGAWLSLGIGATTTALAGFGIASGDIERILRNEPGAAAVLIALIGFGVVAGVVVYHGTIDSRISGWRIGAGGLGILAIGAAVLWTLVADQSTTSQLANPDNWRIAWAQTLLLAIALVGTFWTATAISEIRPNAHQPWKEIRTAAIFLARNQPLAYLIATGVWLAIRLLASDTVAQWPHWALLIAALIVLLAAWPPFVPKLRAQNQAWRRPAATILVASLLAVSVALEMISGSSQVQTFWINSVFGIAFLAITGLSGAGHLIATTSSRRRLTTHTLPFWFASLLIMYLAVRGLITTWRSAVVLAGLWLVVAVLRPDGPTSQVGSTPPLPGMKPLQNPNRTEVTLNAALLAVGFLSFLVGVVGLFNLGIENESAKDRPSVTAELESTDNGQVLKSTVHAEGLRTSDNIVIAIEALNSSVQLSDVVSGAGTQTRTESAAVDSPDAIPDWNQLLHITRIGADALGTVDTEVSVPVSPGLYERIRVTASVSSASQPTASERLIELQDLIQSQREREQRTEPTILDSLSEGDRALALVLLSAVEQQGELGRDLQALAKESHDDQSSELSLPARVEAILWGRSQRAPSAQSDRSIHNPEAWFESVRPTLVWNALTAQQSVALGLDTIRKQIEDSGGSEELRELTKIASRIERTLATWQPTDLELFEALTASEADPIDAPVSASASDLQELEALLTSYANDLANLQDNPGPSESALFRNVDRWVRATSIRIHALANEASGGFDSTGSLLDVSSAIFERTERLELEAESDVLQSEVLDELGGAVRCREVSGTRGCAIVLLPELQTRPKISAEYTTVEAQRVVELTVVASQLAATDFVSVVLDAEFPDGSPAQTILKTYIPAAVSGAVEESMAVVLPANSTGFCARAELHRSVILRSLESVPEPNDSCEITSPTEAVVSVALPTTTTTTTMEETTSTSMD